MGERPAMIEAAATPDQARRVYDLWSHFYGWWAPLFERRPQMIALDRTAILPHEKVLEVAMGAGGILLEIVRRVDPANTVCGIDLSPKMLAKARRRVTKAGHANIDLREADARCIPFPDDTFDVLFNSYMFDLLPLAGMPIAEAAAALGCSETTVSWRLFAARGKLKRLLAAQPKSEATR